ncbi:MAG: carbon storage regulator CsrA [Lentisphaerae bacterium]|nr:carbon storage regulator CsrA [Lentisphaerota bacterium]
MLVLTRKLEEGVMIGDEIEVRVLGIHGDQVRLGFSAPRNVPVFRKEVFVAIQEENRQAAQSASGGMDAVADSLRESKEF